MITIASLQHLYEPATSTSLLMQQKLYMWPKRILYFGPLRYVEPHTYGATILMAGLYGPFSIRVAGGEWLNCSCVIIPAGLKHEVNLNNGILGKLFIEGGSLDHQFFSQRFSYNKKLSFFHDSNVIDCFRDIYENNISSDTSNEKIDRLIGFCDDQPFTLDPRVDHAIDLITADLTQNLSEQFLSKEVDLSASRFRHLFHEKTGVSYRHYRTWKRLVSAAENINKTDNFTFSALESGFSDLPHFSKHYKNTFGVKPSYVFRHLNEFHIA